MTFTADDAVKCFSVSSSMQSMQGTAFKLVLEIATTDISCAAPLVWPARHTSLGIPVHRDQRFRSIVTGHSGPS